MAPPAAPPQWVVLRRRPRTSLDLPKDDGISLALDAPPRITQLVVPPSLVASGSRVLAADPDGFLLLSDSCGADPLAADKPASTSYDIWDAVFRTSSRLPTPETPVNGDTGAAGLIADRGRFGHYHIMVAELELSSVCDNAATLRCFSTDTDKWTLHKILRSPLIKFPWCSAHVLSHRGRLWWVDLLQGLLACNPFADKPELHFVPLPSCYRIVQGSEQCLRKGLSKDRCVSLSRGKLRLVVITRRASLPKIKLWTLADHEAGKWTLDFEVLVEDVWADQSYLEAGLPNERPVLAFVHPGNPHVVYFFLKELFFAVDLQTKTVTESASNGTDDEEPSSSLVLAWELPPSLRMTSSGPSPTESRPTFGFDSIADTFCEAYGFGLADMEFHELAKIALASLNKKKKTTEENKFKLSEGLFLQIFDESLERSEKKYAHLNFYADSGSEKVLVFAELHSDALGDYERDNWALSSCKILKRNYHGGLYGEDANVRRSKGTKKRKKSLYCYACAAELLHPMCGFDGGYAATEWPIAGVSTEAPHRSDASPPLPSPALARQARKRSRSASRPSPAPVKIDQKTKGGSADDAEAEYDCATLLHLTEEERLPYHKRLYKKRANMGLAWYNKNNPEDCYEFMSMLLKDVCEFMDGGVCYMHMNFKATNVATRKKKLFFAELVLDKDPFGENSGYSTTTCSIVDDNCVGGTKHQPGLRNGLAERYDEHNCYACAEEIKHPTGKSYKGGHYAEDYCVGRWE